MSPLLSFAGWLERFFSGPKHKDVPAPEQAHEHDPWQFYQEESARGRVEAKMDSPEERVQARDYALDTAEFDRPLPSNAKPRRLLKPKHAPVPKAKPKRARKPS